MKSFVLKTFWMKVAKVTMCTFHLEFYDLAILEMEVCGDKDPRIETLCVFKLNKV